MVADFNIATPLATALYGQKVVTKCKKRILQHGNERCFPLSVPLPLNLVNIFMTAEYFGIECNIYVASLTITPSPTDAAPPLPLTFTLGGGALFAFLAGIRLELQS